MVARHSPGSISASAFQEKPPTEFTSTSIRE
jgi:hypothetical protein